MCSLFRNEVPDRYLSSELITQAVAATRAVWSEPPDLGFVTFVDARQVRHKRDPGRCYRRVGWEHVGYTQGGLLALQLLPDQMPEAHSPLGFAAQLPLSFDEESGGGIMSTHVQQKG